MSRYNKILGSKIVRFGLPLLAGYLLITEGVLWRKQLAQNTQSLAESTGQLQDAVRPSLGETQGAAVASQAPLANLTEKATFEQVRDVPSGVFAYGGSTTWAPIRKGVDPGIQVQYADFQLQYTSPAPNSGRTAGSGTGIRMLLDDELLFSQSSRPLKADEKAEAQRQGYDLQAVAIAIDGIAIAVNPALEIPGITVAQLRDIYTGRITNWQEVGGPNVATIPYARRLEDSGTTEFFTETVLEGAPLSPNVQFAESTTAGVRQVSENLGGIYYASAPEIVGQCLIRPLPIANSAGLLVAPYVSPYVKSSECPRYRNQLNVTQFQSGEYPITRQLFVIVKQNGEMEEQVGVAYANLLLSAEGQELISSTGFVKMPNP